MLNIRFANKRAIFLAIGIVSLRGYLFKSPRIYLIIPNIGILHKFWTFRLHRLSNSDFK